MGKVELYNPADDFSLEGSEKICIYIVYMIYMIYICIEIFKLNGYGIYSNA